MIRIITYLRPIIEGKDGKPSIRRLFAIGFFVGIIRMLERSYVTSCVINADALMWLIFGILALLGLITYQHLNEMKNDFYTDIYNGRNSDYSQRFNGNPYETRDAYDRENSGPGE